MASLRVLGVIFFQGAMAGQVWGKISKVCTNEFGDVLLP